MKLKAGVKLQGITPELITGILIVNEYFRDNIGREFVITSVTDGEHRENSYHYSGQAIDVRTRHLIKAHLVKHTAAIQKILGDEFIVILEPDHIHIHWRPE